MKPIRGLGKILLGFSLLTGVMLVYVGEHVEILRASYRIDAQTDRLSEKSEELRRLRFDVARLRSPRLLEKRLEELSLPLTLPEQIQALKVPVGPVLSQKSISVAPSSHHFFDFLGQWIQVAQARIEE